MSATHVKCSRTEAKKTHSTHAANEGGGWHFINISESKPDKHPEYRKIVRAHAARDYRRKQRQQLCRIHPTSASNSPSAQSFTSPSRNIRVSIRSSRLIQHEPGAQVKSLSFDDDFHWPTGGNQSLHEAKAGCADLGSSSRSSNQMLHLEEKGYGTRGMIASAETPAECQIPDISPHLLLGRGNQDPFDAYPIKCSSQSAELLYHCKYLWFNYVNIILCSFLFSLSYGLGWRKIQSAKSFSSVEVTRPWRYALLKF